MARTQKIPRASDKEEKRGIVISPMALVHARRKRNVGKMQMAPPSFPSASLPPEADRIAQDEAISGITTWANGDLSSAAFLEGTTFLGYAYLAMLAQRAEYRVISETIAYEMTREGIEFESVGDEDKTDRIKALESACRRFKVMEVLRRSIEGDGFMGRGHIYIDTGETEDKEELKQSIGTGKDERSRLKVTEKSLRAFRTVEATWAYPMQYNTTDPLREDWYRPETWYVMNKEVHSTRFLTFVGRPVQDILKPAYAFGGLSMTQMVKPYVDNWLRTRQSVADLLHSFSTQGIKTNLGASLQQGGDALTTRAEIYNEMRDNRGLMLLDKETEEFFQVSTPIGGLDSLQAQSQEHMAAIARIPIVKLLGIQPAGLNASSEGEIRAFYDWIKAFQEALLREHLQTMIYFIMLSEFGEIDLEITFRFKDLWQLDEEKKVAIEKTKADIDAEYEQMGVIDQVEIRRRIAGDKESLYHALDLDPEQVPQQQDPMGGELGGEVDEFGNPIEPDNDNLEPGMFDGLSDIGGFKGDLGPGEKLEKSEVQYEAPAQGPDHCGICQHYEIGRCEIVRGRIRPEDWCNKFDEVENGEDAGFEETKHPRNKGKFAKAAGAVGSAVAGAGKRRVNRFANRDYEVLKKGFHKAGSEPRKGIAGKLSAIAKTIPQIFTTHLREEKDKAVHAAGALKSLATGNRPTPEQLKGLQKFGLSVLMSAGSMALTGDATGSIPHLLSSLGSELVHHAIMEHSAKIGAGLGKFGLRKMSGADADIEGLDAESCDHLKSFLATLSDVVENLDVDDSHYKELINEKGGLGEDRPFAQGSAHPQAPPGSRQRSQQTLSRTSRQRSASQGLKIGSDAEFNEADHPRGQPDNPGQFAKGGGGGQAKPGGSTTSRSTSKSGGLKQAEGNRQAWPEHIQALKLPPAWKEVRYNEDPDADLLAIGKDAKGRPQYVYSEEFAKSQSAAKFARVKDLERNFSEMLRKNDDALNSSDKKVVEHAACLGLIMATGIRPGSEKDTKSEKQAYGATTLRSEHVVEEDGHVLLKFTGKKGVSLSIPVGDNKIADELKQRARDVGPEGQLFPTVTDKSLRDYTNGLTNGVASPKDFRTLLGTSLASHVMQQMPMPTNKTGYRKAVMKVAKMVSEKLGNTPTIALQSYISPYVFSEWRLAGGDDD